ncbi:MAG TPA: hypothetical protein VGA43_11210 [Deferrimonas sp.]|jgi:peptidoglycan/LPS O-acetylase OafA/YrhL
MDVSTVVDFFKNFETGKVVTALQEMKVGDLIHNPLFLGAMGVLALLALIMRWRTLLTTILAVVGFAGLLSYTLQQDTSLTGLNNQTLLVFVGGGAVLIMIVIYLLFIKSD